ncbi:MAG: hypothetical protein OCC49_18025 [Fibrobacterales bacterium]
MTNKYSYLFLFIFLVPSLFAQESEEATSQNTYNSVFKPAYTLGRLTEGGIIDADGSIDYVDKVSIFTVSPRFYKGKEQVYSMYISPTIGWLSSDDSESDIVIARLLYVQGQYMVSPGHMLYLSMVPTNLWATKIFSPQESDSKYGTEDPAVTINTYGSKLLTNNGEIRITPEEYQLAFFNGPMLNKMQYQHDVSVVHQWWDSFDLENFDYSGDLGLLNNVTIGATFNLDHTKQYIYNGNDKSKYSKTTSLRIKGRTDKLFGSLSYSSSDKSASKIDFNSTIKKTGSLITLSGGYLHGTRALTFDNVNGNWDNYYDQTLGKGQILGNAALYIAPYMDDGSSAYDINAELDGAYGISDQLNVGAIFFRNGGRGNLDAKNTIALKSSYCSVPLRDYGPAQAPVLEYHFGKKPSKGEFKADIWIKLPIADNYNSLSMNQADPKHELFRATAIAGLTDKFYGEGTISYDNIEDGDNQNISVSATGGIQSEFSQIFVSWSVEILEDKNEFGALSAGARILF